jgi:nitrite reductase (NADH) small subunit
VRHRVASLADLPQGCGYRVTVGAREIALFRRGDRVYALDGICPHRGALLAFGEVRDGIVHCPLHAWGFDVRSGACAELEHVAQESFRVHVEGGEVLVEL